MRQFENSLPLDHLVLLARELDRAVDDLEQRLGVRAAVGGRHPAFGTHNALLSLGEVCYLEIIAIDPHADPTQIRRRWPFIPRGWPWHPRGEDEPSCRLVNFAARSANVEQHVEAARSRGFDPGEIMSMSREKPDGTRLGWKLALRSEPAFDGVVPFLIDWGSTPHPARSCPRGCALIELRGEHPHPAAASAALDALGVELDLRLGPKPLLLAVIDSPRGRSELR